MMVLVVTLLGFGAMALAHMAPFPFLLEYMGPDRSLWRMPRSDGAPTVYLTFDDGPNPTATPQLLDVLGAEGVKATFFLIPRHITGETAPIVRRMFDEGHAVALHWHSRELMLLPPTRLAATLDAAAEEIEHLTGHRPCRLFRPHAGWRGSQMYAGLARADYTLAGFSYSMWDWNWWRAQPSARIVTRLAERASDGSVIVMHDGHHANPRADRRRTVVATAELVPVLRARGFEFGLVCQPEPNVP
jgi:chitooligosaccharide deacetylase